MLTQKKKVIILLVFILVGIKIYAQPNATLVQFPSPEATNLGLVGNLPVSLHTGKASISVPISTGNDKKMPPISLSYNTGGVLPDTHPGWVGNNWTLDAGGVVTRVMNVVPDETEAIGYYQTYATTNSMSLPVNFSGASSGCWNEICIPADGGPDEFYISAPGLSGKFMIDNTGKFQVMDDPSVKIEIEGTGSTDYPRLFDVIEGNTNHPFRGFTITKNDGTKYRFGYTRELIETSCSVVNNVLSGEGYASTWYLAQIIYPNGEAVNYTYTTKVQNRTVSGNTLNYVYYISPLPSGEYAPWDGANLTGGSLSRTATFHAYLQSIETTSTRLDFFISTTNELKNGITDLGNWKKLDSIVVYNKFASAREKSFGFTYDPATNKRLTLLSLTEKGTTGSLPPHQFVYNDAVKLPPYQSGQIDLWGYYNNNQDSTIIPKVIWPDNTNMPFYYSLNREPNPRTVNAGILTQIKYPTGGSVLLEYEPNDYSFFYDYTFNTGPYYFPVTWKWDENQSHWILYKFGDPNGNGEVVQFFETTTPIYATISGFGLDAGPRTVTLPAGHYDIEALQRFLNIPVNTEDRVTYYITYKALRSNPVAKEQGPGLRIKKIYHKSSETNIDFIHEYIYSKDYGRPSYNPALSSGILGNRPNFAVFINGIEAGASTFGTPQGPVAMTEGSPLGYSEVTEITKDKNENILGFITSKYTNFDTHPDDVPSGFHDGYIAIGQKGNRSYERGKLIESATYDQGGKMLKKVTNTYTFFTPSSVSSGISMRKTSFCTVTTVRGTEIYMFTKNYFSTCKISSSKEATFDAANNNFVEQYSDHLYNRYKLDSATTFLTSKGVYKKNFYRYPFSISSPVYNSMTQRNMLSYKVETISYLDSNVTGSALNTFKPVIFNSDTMYLLDKSYKLEINSPLSSFTMFDGSSKDPHYISPSVEFVKYDNKGNPLEAKDQSGVITSYFWGFNGQRPVAKIVGSDYNTAKQYITQSILDAPASGQALRGELNKIRTGLATANAQVSTYTYEPLIGITSETDTRGRTAYYEYDGFQRLKLIRDQDSNVVKTIQYNYAATCGDNCTVLPMLTFNGTNTISYPVGVFNVNGKLVDTASSQARYISVWNSDTANQHRGTLAAGLDSMHFNLTIASGATSIPNAVTGCRYYQYDLAYNRIDGIRNGNAAYVDFGDGTGFFPGKNPNDTAGIILPANTYIYIIGVPYFIHTYPNNNQKTLTFYHNDGKEFPGLDNGENPATSLTLVKNVRGNYPQNMLSLGASCFQQSSALTVSAITNWNSINTITGWSPGNGDNSNPCKNLNYSQDFMANNKGLQSIITAWYGAVRTGYRDTTFKISRLKSDWNTYFTQLKTIIINDDHWNRENLSGLKNLTTFGLSSTTQNHQDDPNSPFVPIPSSVVDNAINQIASGAGQTVKNGLVNIGIAGTARTSASDASVTFLKSKGWTIIVNGITQ